jgi:hypothetical protein
MKLSEHVDKLRTLIEATFEKEFSRLGIGSAKQIELEKLPQELHVKQKRFEEILKNHIGETGSYVNAREKAVDELTFTLFNRIAAVKVMEASSLFPPIFTKQPEHGDRSFGHKAWLEIRPDMRSEELEGIREYIKHAFDELGETLPLYNKNYPYALLPDAISLNEIIDAFNTVEKDPQVEDDIWQSDDVLGWLYESYNNVKKSEFKASKKKVEYDKVSLQSQVYTPLWVVRFLVENSLGKLYLEMYPDSNIKNQYKIANAPKIQEREPKPLHEIKLIDPACGSGNFLLYAFEFFYALYVDQIDNFGVDYDENDIPKLIIENNLHGIDLDDRAVQLAQLGLYIKARKKRRSIGSLKFNVVSSDFFLPDYEETRHIFETNNKINADQKELISDIWGDLQYAYKFGSLIQVDEKLKAKLKTLEKQQKDPQQDFMTTIEIKEHEGFTSTFFNNLKTATGQYALQKGNSFLISKTRDAILFLELLTTKFDVVTANPPYTDSADFGPELKTFIENNYKKPYKFHTNLYATFIKRSYELLIDNGFFATIQPLTFMYIKTFEDVRKFILQNTHLEIFVELGLGGVFLSHYVVVYAASYILKKTKISQKESLFLNFQAYHGKLNKKELFESAFTNYINNITDKHNYSVMQSKLKIIKSWPFIYWISDEFRERFNHHSLDKSFKVCQGLSTGNNFRFIRFWWEIGIENISKDYKNDSLKWVSYCKGGEFNKWAGNMWLCINYDKNGEYLKENGATLRNKEFYLKSGITSSGRSSSKGVSYRYYPDNSVFDSGATGILPIDDIDLFYGLGFMNSKISTYIISCFNPTVNTTEGDLVRIPFFKPNKDNSAIVSNFVKRNIKIKDHLLSYKLIERSFISSPIFKNHSIDNNISIKSFLNYENHFLTQVLINEAIINEKIFEIYELTPSDKAMVLEKEGYNIGGLPVSEEAQIAYFTNEETKKEFPLNNIKQFIESLPVKEFTTEERETVKKGFPSLYQGNNDLEEFCIRHQVNPINVWYWFKQSKVIPQQRKHTLVMEFLTDIIREILMNDEDGIIPLVTNAGGKILIEHVEDKFREKGFSMAQYSSFDTVLGRPINEYISKHFFKELSECLNMFRHLPMTPFIWHLSSGSEQGFDCYIIIYKWSRDKLMRLKSVYIEHRERSLINRQSDLADNESAEAQNEKDKIFKQLKEIEDFKQKIDELLSEGYDPILDDGVGKNIAPLQKKKMIPYEVLNAGQLKKYLNADW